MTSELARIATFSRWPSDAEAEVFALAREGFYYSGNGDGVICSACSVSLDGWKWSESPAEKHRRLSPRCKFVNNGTASHKQCMGHNRDSNSSKGTLVTDSVSIPNLPSTQHVAEPSTSMLEELATAAIQSNELPKYPQYSRLTDRIESFRRGITPQGQTAENLAEAGWFFVGPGDKVRCFQCGGNLRDWELGDCPWTEHRRWYKDCAHLKTVQSSPEPRYQNVTTADAVAFRIDPREVKARMDTPSVRTILNMGYESNLVRQVIENQLKSTGDDFPNAEALLSAIFALNDPQPTAPPHAGHSITHAASITVNSSVATELDNTLSAESSSPKGKLEYSDENQRLRDSRTCKVCKEAEVNTVFLPCGHLVCCDRCSPRLKDCVVCRTSIRGTVKTFLS